MAGTSQKNNTTRTSAASGQKKTNASRSTTGGSSRATASNRNTNGKSGSGSRSTLAKNGGNSRSASGRNANTGTRNASTSQGASARQSAPKPRPQYESFLGPEITFLVLFAVCVLLFLSNLGLCGAVGTAIHGFLRGMFGLMGYVFPVYLFVAVLFYQANRDNGKAIAKVAASIGVFLVFCGLAALLTTKDVDSSTTMKEYYVQAAETLNGGAVGGLFLNLLCPTIGTIGAYVVTILLSTIGIVFITEKSVLQPLSKGGKKVYDTAREDVARRKEEYAIKAEERRLSRLEQKVSGIATDTIVGDGSETAVSAEEDIAQQTAQSVVQKPAEVTSEKSRISITGVGYEQKTGEAQKTSSSPIQAKKTKNPQNSLQMEPLVPERADAPVIPVSGDVLVSKRDTRTLSELEALDSLHGNVFSQTRDKLVWKESEEERQPVVIPTDAGVQMHLRDVKQTVEEKRAEGTFASVSMGEQPNLPWEQEISRLEQDEEPWVAPLDSLELAEAQVGGEWSDSPFEEDNTMEPIRIHRNGMGMDYDAVEPQDTFADVKRVTTASGKMVEVELDPDDDPLTRKRIQNRLQEQAAKNGGQGSGARGSQGDTVSLAGANGMGYYSRPEPESNNKKLVPNWNDEDVSSGNTLPNNTNSGSGQKTPYSGGSRSQQSLGQYGAGTDRTKYGETDKIAAQAKRPPKPYVMPPINLLKAGDSKKRNSDRELRETARKLETTLQSFGVNVTVTNISCGPTVTRYELQPEQGVRVSKIVGLSDDIKLNLAAADIRIEAPIPGKASVGIEVPNKENATVFLRDVLESDSFKNHPSKMAFSVGQDISGGMVVTDLAKMPHLLIAGATGSGKSVCINTLIMSILYKAKPEEVRLIMVDPKVVELSVYNGIPHLMIPVVTDPKKAAGALNWAVAEMTDRYRKFADWNVRDLKGYNEKARAEAEKNGETFTALPQIVIIVDELADLMMVAPGEVEDAICRLAQMARAAGIHLVIATQRPSVNVITGLIKANVPSRIAFSVSSGVDSRTILDMHGAEKLLGKGDMLFYPSGYQKPVRVQGAFVSDGEVASVVEFLSKNNQSQTYDSAIEARLASMDNG
ncbi:MAG: DNA translocase FtsK 4TM domain-containing protein, partial [Lachnospiraceae bacterium]|nr:DNA translocase FtsK 4TM domain-containing protein [Lachnospiraceae bacterium]